MWEDKLYCTQLNRCPQQPEAILSLALLWFHGPSVYTLCSDKGEDRDSEGKEEGTDKSVIVWCTYYNESGVEVYYIQIHFQQVSAKVYRFITQNKVVIVVLSYL